MPIIVSTWGRRSLLARTIPFLGTLSLRLFANDVNPTIAMTELDFIEPVFDGYAPQGLTRWTTVILNAQNRAETDEGNHTWTVGPGGGTGDVYGYWVTDRDGRYIFALRFPITPVPVSSPGDQVRCLVRFLAGALQ